MFAYKPSVWRRFNRPWIGRNLVFEIVSSTAPNSTASVFKQRFKVCSGNGILSIALIHHKASSKQIHDRNDTNGIQSFLACKITGPIPSPASAAILSS
jgi:hypothetical protein